jgi:drug/metabolite transporter (DMT)-like permease
MWKAIFFMLIGMALIPVGDAASKLLSNNHGFHPYFIAWARFAVGSVLVIPFISQNSLKVFRNPLAWIRGVLLAVGISAITVAVSLENLTSVFAVFFVGPIISYILAVVFLKETVNLQRSILLFLGFCGILIIARPGFGFTLGLGFALLAGTAYGIFLTLSRLAASQEDPKGLLISQMAIATVITTPMALLHWPIQNVETLGLITVSGASSMLGNLFLILAYARAPATRLAPFVYFQLIGALFLGWLIFDTWPDGWGMLGLGLLIISGFGSAFLRR